MENNEGKMVQIMPEKKDVQTVVFTGKNGYVNSAQTAHQQQDQVDPKHQKNLLPLQRTSRNWTFG